MNGESCQNETQCESNYCSAEFSCESVSCTDDQLNGTETDVDCGGDFSSCEDG